MRADCCQHRNCGALIPLLNMLAVCRETEKLVKALSTLSFLLLDRQNRRACIELSALDVLLDILRKVSDVQVLYSALDAICSLCRHDARDKVRT